MKTFDKIFKWDDGDTYYCGHWGNHKGNGHSKICKHYVDKDKKIKKLRKRTMS